MAARASTPAAPAPALAPPPPAPHLRRHRLTLADGAQTTLHVATYDAARTDVRVVRLARPRPLEAWCAQTGTAETLVGSFDVRRDLTPLGELRTGGLARAHTPFDAPWDAVRACLHVERGRVRLAPRAQLGACPPGDLLQAGPLLVRNGHIVAVDGEDPEGFAAGARQFDSDITDGRHPRAALALAGDRLLAVAADGRADDEAGLTLGELAIALRALGAQAAINLDGGGSTSLVCAGRLRNHQREQHGIDDPGRAGDRDGAGMRPAGVTARPPPPGVNTVFTR